jgi:hypothetical protein
MTRQKREDDLEVIHMPLWRSITIQKYAPRVGKMYRNVLISRSSCG